MEPLVKTSAYERGSYICFDPNTWETIRKVCCLINLLTSWLLNPTGYHLINLNEEIEWAV